MWPSIDNADETHIAPLRNLPRRDADLAADVVVAEGVETVRWLLRSPYPVGAVIAKPSLVHTLGPDIGEAPAFQADPSALSEVMGFSFTRGVAAWAPRPPAQTWPPVARDIATWLILDGVHDPVNIGSLIRTARCFGVQGVVLGPGCADPWYRRCVRASVGHIFHMPVWQVDDLEVVLTDLRVGGTHVLAAHRGPLAMSLHAWSGCGSRWALVIGNEDRGPRPEHLALCDQHLAIDMATGVDSLNVNAAAAVLLHRLSAPA